MPSIIFWLGWCVTGWEKSTGAIGRWTSRKVSAPPTSTDLHTVNSHCYKKLWASATWKPQSCDCQRLWRYSRSSKNIRTQTQWLLYKWSRQYTRCQTTRVVVFHAQASQNHNYKNTLDEKLWLVKNHWKGVLNLFREWWVESDGLRVMGWGWWVGGDGLRVMGWGWWVEGDGLRLTC